MKKSCRTTEHSLLPEADWRRRFRRAILRWYDKNARDLPWRRTSDPYAVWLSEIMLQQTQVATVIGYFDRFLTELPTISDLAAADREQVFRLWEGLGYYRRAAQLHEAAQVIVERHDGRFPETFDEVHALPGIGRYTAGAILSIARDQSLPILEANTIRLFARLLGFDESVDTSAGQRLLWEMAECVLPRKSPGRFNQALMDFGSRMCTVGAADCGDCPTASLCEARRQGIVEQLPVRRAKQAIESVQAAAVLVRRGDRLLVRRYEEGQRWAGLWDFPRFDLPADLVRKIGGPPAEGGGKKKADAAVQRLMRGGLASGRLSQFLVDQVRKLADVPIDAIDYFTVIRHGVTRYRITLSAFTAQADSDGSFASNGNSWRWASLEELEDLPLSSTGRKLADLAAIALEDRPAA